MILGVIADDVTYAIVQTMNFRRTHDIRQIKANNLQTIQKEIETTGVYTHVLLDVDALHGNSDNAVALLERLRQTTTVQYLVLADGYPDYGRLVQDILALGIPSENIMLAAGTRLKMRLGEILNTAAHAAAPELIRELEPELPAVTEILLPEISPEPPTTDDVNNVQEQAEPILPPQASELPRSVIPPSQITTAEAKALLRENMLQLQKENMRTAITIAVAGAGHRMGATTQALQLLMFLRTKNYTAALVEMHGQERLRQFKDVYVNSEIDNSGHLNINGNLLITDAAELAQAKKEYDVLVLDYGAYSECDMMSYLKNNLKLVCAGVKPWETQYLNEAFCHEDESMCFLFSFVPPADEPIVREQMESSSDKTFFAVYAPDMFQYCGNDAVYEKILDRARMAQEE